jgi:hypothetical protein
VTSTNIEFNDGNTIETEGPCEVGPGADPRDIAAFPKAQDSANAKLELVVYCFFGVTSMKGIAPPVTFGILPFHF